VKSLSAKRLIRVLEANGFELARSRGSHMIFRNQEAGVIVPVPVHGGTAPIPIGTFLSIVRQSKIDPSKFV
jgi:mRNA interferase HicA